MCCLTLMKFMICQLLLRVKLSPYPYGLFVYIKTNVDLMLFASCQCWFLSLNCLFSVNRFLILFHAYFSGIHWERGQQEAEAEAAWAHATKDGKDGYRLPGFFTFLVMLSDESQTSLWCHGERNNIIYIYIVAVEFIWCHPAKIWNEMLLKVWYGKTVHTKNIISFCRFCTMPFSNIRQN